MWQLSCRWPHNSALRLIQSTRRSTKNVKYYLSYNAFGLSLRWFVWSFYVLRLGKRSPYIGAYLVWARSAHARITCCVVIASKRRTISKGQSNWMADDMLRYHDQTCISDNTQLSPQACATAVDVALRGDVQSCLVLRRDGLASVGSAAGWQLGRGLVWGQLSHLSWNSGVL